jgi:polyisoprenoid-binding protein YceI
MSTDITIEPFGLQYIAHGRWRLDPAQSRLEFCTPTLWGLATVTGHVDRYDGILDLRRSPAIGLTIEADSLSTNNGFRDRHLRSDDSFDVRNHPEVRFVSETPTLHGETLSVRGRLDAAGSSLPLAFDAHLRRVDDDVELEARAHADHRRFGMSHGLLGMIRTPSELIVHGRLVRAPLARTEG